VTREPKRSRYFDNGAPMICYRCGRPFDGCAIRDGYTDRYFCSDACLERVHALLFGQLLKAS
jgi:hypothetical protein